MSFVFLLFSRKNSVSLRWMSNSFYVNDFFTKSFADICLRFLFLVAFNHDFLENFPALRTRNNAFCLQIFSSATMATKKVSDIFTRKLSFDSIKKLFFLVSCAASSCRSSFMNKHDRLLLIASKLLRVCESSKSVFLISHS